MPGTSLADAKAEPALFRYSCHDHSRNFAFNGHQVLGAQSSTQLDLRSCIRKHGTNYPFERDNGLLQVKDLRIRLRENVPT